MVTHALSVPEDAKAKLPAPLENIEPPAVDTAGDSRPFLDDNQTVEVQGDEELPIAQADKKTERSRGGFVADAVRYLLP